jgi:hypothetical protein
MFLNVEFTDKKAGNDTSELELEIDVLVYGFMVCRMKKLRLWRVGNDANVSSKFTH